MDTMVVDPAANDGTTLSDLLQGARDAMSRGLSFCPVSRSQEGE